MASAERRPLVAGNWKMNGLRASAGELARMVSGAAGLPDDIDLMVCPPATLIAEFARLAHGSRIIIGGQDCHAAASGAHTGDIAAEMLADAGARMVIVGHSERRVDHRESDAAVAAKALAAGRAGLEPIICVGESGAERSAKRTLEVVGRQLMGSIPEEAARRSFVVAYEPVWAIGTGLTPTPTDVGEVHDFIRGRLVERFGAAGAATRILYGGSVKPSNAAELTRVPHVDGVLVGGASLKADDFLGIARACCG